MPVIDVTRTMTETAAAVLDLPAALLSGPAPVPLDDDDALALMIAVEAALDVRFPDDFLEGITTFDQFTRAVRLAVGS
jgi:hypothetical protein